MSITAAFGNATLGCDNDYKVLVTDSCGAVLRRVRNVDVTSMKYNVILDSIGTAEISMFHDDCSNYLSIITPGRSYLQINRNDVPVFRGPITRVELNDESVRVIASDPLWWVSRRVYIPTVTQFTDPVSMFEALVLKGTNSPELDPGSDCAPDFLPLCFEEVHRLPGGSAITAATEATSLRTIMDDMANTTIDYTVVGTTLLYGYKEVPVPYIRTQRRPLLTEKSWIASPAVIFDISSVTNDVRIRSSLAELYRKTKCGDGNYGHHQSLVDHSEITTKVQADGIASTYLALGDSTVFVENISNTQLSPDVQWDIPRMVPGMQVDIGITVQGINVAGTLRLHEVAVTVEGGSEVVTVGLEPVGAT